MGKKRTYKRPTGSLTERKGVRGVAYQLKWELPRDPLHPKMRKFDTKTMRNVTEDEAKIELNRTIESLYSGTYVAPSAGTLGEFCEWWLENRPYWGKKKLRANTLSGYRLLLEAYVLPDLGAEQLQKITSDAIQAFYTRLQKEGRIQKRAAAKGLSARTVLHIHLLLGQILKRARVMKRMAHNAMEGVSPPAVDDSQSEDVEVEAQPEGQGKALDEKQLARLIDGFQKHSLGALVRLAAQTGMRRGELLAARWQDIDFEKSLLRVERTVVNGGRDEKTKETALTFARPKTKRSRRAITLGIDTLADLKSYRTRQGEIALAAGRRGELSGDCLLFPYSISEPRRPRNPGTVTSAFIQRARRLGFVGLRLHDLRHTHGSLLIRAGVDIGVVSRRLGHASSAITLNVYQHMLPGMQEGAADQIDQLIRKGAAQ